jgi:cyclophilin family peptidyl-prolyl cis-trans isomerase
VEPEDTGREAALPALHRLNGDDVEPYLVAALARRDYQLLRTAATEAKSMAAVPQLAGALLDALTRVTAERKETSRDTRLALLDALHVQGTPDQAGALVPLLRDFDIPVARRAGALLHEWTGKLHEIAPQLLPRPPLPLDVELTEARDVPARVTLASGLKMAITLRPDVAPLASVRFLRLVKAGYFDGLTFHRVVPNFIIQGGSPGANEYVGDALYVRDEIDLASNAYASVGLSTRGRDTGDAQFYINLADNPRLDYEYSVFGMTAAPGLDEILEGDRILKMTFEKETTARGRQRGRRRPM